MIFRRSPPAVISIFLFLFLFFSTDFIGQTTDNLADSQQWKPVIDKFMEKIIQDNKIMAAEYSHFEREVRERLERDVVVEREENFGLVQEINGKLSKKLLSKNGRAIKNSKFQEKKARILIDNQLFEKYVFIFEGEETIDGQKCWRFAIYPQKNHSENNKIDRVLNNINGQLWMVAQGFYFKQLRVKLVNKVDYVWPGFTGGQIKKLDAFFQAKTIDNHAALSYVRIEFIYAIKFLGFFSKEEHGVTAIHYENYEKRKR